MYDFNQQLKLGKNFESHLDAFFTKWYSISPVDLQIEINDGIDRIFSRNGKQFKIEYKTDFKAALTGNAYIELSVDSDNGRSKLGWAAGSKADYIIYAVVDYADCISQIYVLDNFMLKNHLDKWKGQYRHVTCQNNGYHSKGVLVPISVLESDNVVKTAFKSI